MFEHFCGKFKLKRNPSYSEVVNEYEELSVVNHHILRDRYDFELFRWEMLTPGTLISISGFDNLEVEEYIRLGAARLGINVVCKVAGKKRLKVIRE